MKSFRSIISLSLALLMLLSTAGYGLSLHFCGGEFQEVSFFSSSKSCPIEKQLPPCHQKESSDHEQKELTHHNCCKDQLISAEKIDLQNGSIFKIDFQTVIQCIAVGIPSFFYGLIHTPIKSFSSFYIIPLIERDIPVLVQSFLI